MCMPKPIRFATHQHRDIYVYNQTYLISCRLSEYPSSIHRPASETDRRWGQTDLYSQRQDDEFNSDTSPTEQVTILTTTELLLESGA